MLLARMHAQQRSCEHAESRGRLGRERERVDVALTGTRDGAVDAAGCEVLDGLGRAVGHQDLGAGGEAVVGVAVATAIGLANQCLPDEGFFEAVEAFVDQVLANSSFSHRANKRLLTGTDGLSLSAGLAYEVYQNEGVGPDMQARIAAFTAKKG